MKITAGVADAFLSLSRRRVRLPAPQSAVVESLRHLLARRSVSRDRVQASAAPQAAHQKSEDCVLFPERQCASLVGRRSRSKGDSGWADRWQTIGRAMLTDEERARFAALMRLLAELEAEEDEREAAFVAKVGHDS